MVIVVAWATSGPVFNYSDTWQLVIDTGTTIITFLMVFLVQNSQNRDAGALQAKLDELIRGVRGRFIGIEHLTDKQIKETLTALEKDCQDDPNLMKGKSKTAGNTVERLLSQY